MNKLTFEILINDCLSSIDLERPLSITENKYLLSIINDFEEGIWRYKKFQNYIWNNIAQTALSKKERESLIDHPQTTLTESAKNLRLANDTGKGSELSEILLYGIMKDHYQALSIVPKIFYKQNTQDNAKGADSVHIVLENNNDFSLWFGEAKFYQNIESSFTPVVNSLKNFLGTTDQIRKENSLITNYQDLDNQNLDEVLLANIKDALSTNNSIDNIKPKINIPILILYECNITNSKTELTDGYKKEIIINHKEQAESYFQKQLEKLNAIQKYKEIKFHLILFPIPDKEKIVTKFIEKAKFHREL